MFGHFGDRIGRKTTLVASLLVMGGIATFLIGVLPTYHQVGLLAPALLAVMRFSQGLALGGGEWSGAALLATETAKPGKRAWAAMWPQLGAPFGFLLANGGVFLVLVLWLGFNTASPDLDGAFLTWGWRVPFLLSAVMVAIGLYVRLRLTETPPVFARAIERGERVRAPLTEVFRNHWRQLLIGTFVMLATYTLFYVVTTWALSFGTGKKTATGGGLGIPYLEFLQLQLISVLFFAAMLPVTGLLADRFGRRVTLLVITVAIMIYGTTFGLLLDPASATTTSTLAFLIIGMTLMGADVRTDERGAARAFSDERAVHRLRNRLQRGEHPRRRDRTVRRHVAGHLLRRGVGGCLPAVRRGADRDRVVGHAGDAGHLPRRR